MKEKENKKNGENKVSQDENDIEIVDIDQELKDRKKKENLVPQIKAPEEDIDTLFYKRKLKKIHKK